MIPDNIDLEQTKEDIAEAIDFIKDTVDDTLNSNETAAIGAGLLAAGLIGFHMRHTEIALFAIAEGADIIEEAASEIGGLTSAVEVGGD